MRRLPLLTWVLAVSVALFLLYHVKYEVMSLQSQVKEVARELEVEREALHVAAAEWAYLNRPERLRSLAEKHLSATPLTVHQVAEIEAIAFPSQAQASLGAPIPPTLTGYKAGGGNVQ